MEKRGNDNMEDDQQYCLRWNNHQSTLIQNFDTLLESGTLVDCTLAAEGKYLKAHKVVLSACSPFFEGLLSEHYDKHPVFILKDVKFKELKAMMDYMYRGEVNISQDQLAALLKAAESLQIKGLSECKTSGSSKTDSRQPKVAPQPTAPPLDISYSSSGLTIEKNKVPRQGMAQGSIGDVPEDSASPQVPKGLSSREGSQSPISRKRRRRRRSGGEDNSVENHEASNSSDVAQQMGVPALGITPVADEKAHADPTDSLGRSALMTQLTKPADEMLQLPLEKPESNDNLIEPKSEYLEDPEESVEDLTLDDDMNDLNEMEQDSNRAGPSHDPSQHPAGLGAWHVTGDRSNAGGVVGSVAGTPGTTDEVFLAAQEAAQAHRDSQERDGLFVHVSLETENVSKLSNTSSESFEMWDPVTALEMKLEMRNVSLRSSKRARKTRDIQLKSSERARKSRHSPSGSNERAPEPRDSPSRSSERAPEPRDSPSRSNERAPEPRDSPSRSNKWAPESHDSPSRSSERAPEPRNSPSRSSEAAASSLRQRNSPETWYGRPDIEICCKHCGGKFHGMNTMGIHVKYYCPQLHASKKLESHPYQCEQCGRCFTKRKTLTYHARHNCNVISMCHTCLKEFRGPVPKRHEIVCREKHQAKWSKRGKFSADEEPFVIEVDTDDDASTEQQETKKKRRDGNRD